MCGKYVTSSVQWWKVPVTKVLCLKGYSTTLNCVAVFAKTYKHSLMYKKLPFNSSFEVFALHMMTIGDRINGSFCVFLAASKTFFFFFFLPHGPDTDCEETWQQIPDRSQCSFVRHLKVGMTKSQTAAVGRVWISVSTHAKLSKNSWAHSSLRHNQGCVK